jgi:cytochrome P450
LAKKRGSAGGQRNSADGLLSLAKMELQDRVGAWTPAGRDGGRKPVTGTSEVIGAAPWSDHDPYTDAALLDPWPGYKQMRDAGPAVWLPKYKMFALTRYDSVRRALQDWESFPSRHGVMMNDRMNQVLRGNTLCSDGTDHDALRDVLVRPLTPTALRPVRTQITAEAECVVQKLVAQGTFDAATELANHLPVTVVSSLIGLPEKGRERMLVWAEEMFNCFGPINDRTNASFQFLDEMMAYATNEEVADKLRPNSWAAGIHDAVARGEVPAEACPAMMIDYLGPSLDTTIFAISNAVWLFANNPDQWELVREDLWLMPSAINEVLRYDAPIQGFSRYVARDVDIDGVRLPAGSRAIVFYGAANRDERKYPDPDRFDVLRRPGDHLGFGAGPHACVGMNLARMEMLALFTALAKHVQRFTILEQEPVLNNVLRGFKTLRVAVS